MIHAGTDHTCGHPMVIDHPEEPARCAVCEASMSWGESHHHALNRLLPERQRSVA